jgi:hypothetical protein
MTCWGRERERRPTCLGEEGVKIILRGEPLLVPCIE